MLPELGMRAAESSAPHGAETGEGYRVVYHDPSRRSIPIRRLAVLQTPCLMVKLPFFPRHKKASFLKSSANSHSNAATERKSTIADGGLLEWGRPKTQCAVDPVCVCVLKPKMSSSHYIRERGREKQAEALISSTEKPFPQLSLPLHLARGGAGVRL